MIRRISSRLVPRHSDNTPYLGHPDPAVQEVARSFGAAARVWGVAAFGEQGLWEDLINGSMGIGVLNPDSMSPEAKLFSSNLDAICRRENTLNLSLNNPKRRFSSLVSAVNVSPEIIDVTQRLGAKEVLGLLIDKIPDGAFTAIDLGGQEGPTVTAGLGSEQTVIWSPQA